MFETHVLLGCSVIFVGLYPFAEAAVKFTARPNNPTYIHNGSTAKLVWDYSDPNNDLRGIAFSVLVNDSNTRVFKRMLVKQNGVVSQYRGVPSTYKGRVSVEGTATLVINKVTPKDNTEFTCKLFDGSTNPESNVQLIVADPPKIQIVIVSSLASWVGQAVTLKCQSDGVPTPTLTWYKPDGNEIFRVTNKEITVQVALKDSGDFGDYKCVAENGLTPRDEKIVKLNQIKKPGAASIISTEADVHAGSLTVRWTAPADDGGSPITAYRVIILKGDTKKGGVNITGLRETKHTFTGLERHTNYTVKVFARNSIFEGDPAVKTLRTKFEGIPAAVEIYGLPNETTEDTITLRWIEPEDNGKKITQYTVYQRTIVDGRPRDWTVIKEISDAKIREIKVKLEKLFLTLNSLKKLKITR